MDKGFFLQFGANLGLGLLSILAAACASVGGGTPAEPALQEVRVEAESFTAQKGGAVKVVEGRPGTSGNACIVGWDAAGHELGWDFSIEREGKYQLVLRYANGRDWSVGRTIKIDGAPVSAKLSDATLPPTGGFAKEDASQWHDLVVGDAKGPLLISLKAGKHHLSLGSVLAGGDNASANFDHIRFVPEGMSPVPSAAEAKAAVDTRLPAILAGLPKAGNNDLAGDNDEFDDAATLAGWNVFSKTEGWIDRIRKLDIGRTEPGALSIQPVMGGWWKGYHGSLVYKTVKGNFFFTSRVKLKGLAGALPATPWNRAGILVRRPGNLTQAPADRTETFVHVMYAIDDNKRQVFYSGNSEESQYDFVTFPAEQTGQALWVELGILRIGRCVVTLTRSGPEGWVVRKRVHSASLPDEVQLGLSCSVDPIDENGKLLTGKYSLAENRTTIVATKQPVDCEAAFDWARFLRVSPGGDLSAYLGGAINNPTVLSNEGIVKILNALTST